MIAVDTNILVRLLTGDDEKQAARVKKLFSSEKRLFIPDTVILETEWVLRFAYEFSNQQINRALSSLFGLPNIHLEAPLQIKRVLELHQDGLDFADALHLAKSQNQASALVTFDKQFIKQAAGKGDCEVRVP